ncbi:O-antigen ligase family protein [Micromonospora costi]|uniref:O-antigen ligase domain-containing protein n=1 Tax=Micromonospora costi TaxID=1530042 RepID=A0A3B0A9F1_9ACTN|nr:O-antigen ligase family protein [Micromonospora costi]RKN57221.1 O-antigen ligase domain-containing protein [Micromonospora costi]
MPATRAPATSDPAGGDPRPAGPPAPVPPSPVPLLPLWPLAVMFGLVPLWWLAGAFYLGWSLLGALLFAWLVVRGRVPLPPATGLWLLFLALVVLSATRLTSSGSVPAFGLRLGFYLTALVVGVYVYALARERADLAAVLVPLCAFWLGLVALGWLAVLVPRLALTTPTELLLPAGVAGDSYVQDLVHVAVTEYSQRSLDPIFRPAAPFPYTNNYGSAYAMTLPCVVAFTMLRGRGALRWVLLASLPLSLAPAFLTLNRVMFVSLGAGLAVLGVRAALRGNVRVGASVVGVLVIGGLATLFIPVAQLIGDRVESSDTNADRFSLYAEVLRRIGDSPWLGYGAPVNTDTVTAQAPVGTQGQLWMVLFSHGVPALLCFLAWFVAAALRCRRANSAAGQWLAVVPVVCLVQIPFYGMASPTLSIAFFAIAIAVALTEREAAAGRTRPAPPARHPAAVPA